MCCVWCNRRHKGCGAEGEALERRTPPRRAAGMCGGRANDWCWAYRGYHHRVVRDGAQGGIWRVIVGPGRWGHPSPSAGTVSRDVGRMVVLLHGKSAGKVRMPAEAEAAMTNVTTVRTICWQADTSPSKIRSKAGRAFWAGRDQANWKGFRALRRGDAQERPQIHVWSCSGDGESGSGKGRVRASRDGRQPTRTRGWSRRQEAPKALRASAAAPERGIALPLQASKGALNDPHTLVNRSIPCRGVLCVRLCLGSRNGSRPGAPMG